MNAETKDAYCIMCGAAPGEPCTVISGDPEAGEKPGDVRATPHFYRGAAGGPTPPFVAVKDEGAVAAVVSGTPEED
jgi:hypothetical protein